LWFHHADENGPGCRARADTALRPQPPEDCASTMGFAKPGKNGVVGGLCSRTSLLRRFSGAAVYWFQPDRKKMDLAARLALTVTCLPSRARALSG